MFGQVDVGSAFEQFRGQPRGQLRRQGLIPLPTIRGLDTEGSSTRDPLRIISQKNVDRIFGLPDLALQVRNLGICSIKHLSRLKHVKPCADTVGKAQFGKLDGILLSLHRLFCDLKL